MDLSASVAQFSAKFVNELDKNKSVVSSPLSCEVLLALLTLGSTDPAHSELVKTLGLSSDAEIRKSFTSLASTLKTAKGITLDIANKVYIKEGNYNLHAELNKDAVDVFNAELEKVDFEKGALAAKIINDWVENKTNKKIKDLISADSVNADTRLVLVNAIYFKGSWKNKFDERATQDRDFFVTANQKIKVPMMAQETNFRYGTSDALGAQLLEMPYEGGDASMLIILPNEIEGLNGVLEKLANGHDLMAEHKKMYSTKVNVIIPKFKIETEIDLKPLLQKLGIQAIFDGSKPNGLTKILDKGEPLFVSKAVQKAFIEVNEEGTEAAAATAQLFRMRRSLPRPVPEFHVSRPALWCILAHGHVMFEASYRPAHDLARDEL